MVIWHRNWLINTIDRQWPWLNFYNDSPPAWAAPDLRHGLPLRLVRPPVISYFLRRRRSFFGAVYCETVGISFSPRVSRWRQWLETTDDSSPPMVSRIQIVYTYYLCLKMLLNIYFGACWLFVIANLSPPSLHPLLMVVIVKSSGGENCWFERHHSAADVLMNRAWLCSGEKKALF